MPCCLTYTSDFKFECTQMKKKRKSYVYSKNLLYNKFNLFRMKNLFLTLAFVLMGGFAFANISDEKKVEETKVVVELKDINYNIFDIECNYSITRTITYSDGTTSSETRHFSTTAINERDCRSIAANHTRALTLGLAQW